MASAAHQYGHWLPFRCAATFSLNFSRLMAGQSPNSVNIALTRRQASSRVTIITHPEYQYWRLDWVKIRDCLAGQRVIKYKNTLYLKKMPGASKESYEDYLDGAVFFNMASQTLKGMLGQVFRRNPVIKNFPVRLKQDLLNGIGKDNSTHTAFTKTVISEMIAMGRYGVLVDAPETITPVAQSYMVGYAAENIMDWSIENYQGRQIVTRVLLREWQRQQLPVPADEKGVTYRNPYTWPYHYKAYYRELLLISADTPSGLMYVQNTYIEDPTGQPEDTVIPTINGNPLEFIPFVFFGASGNTAETEKPPLLDICDLNLSHYRSYADLEHGRKFTALPVYYAPGDNGTGVSEYHIGPDMVWEVPTGATPGILEYKGEGLKALESALTSKEGQISAIGGRMVAGSHSRSSTGGENTQQTEARESAEQSILVDCIGAAQDGMTMAMRYWCAFRDYPMSQSWELSYEVNTDFLAPSVGAREMRAIQQLYQEGYVPIEVLHDYLQKGQVIADDMEFADFAVLMNDPKAFINNPDVHAKQRGYNTRQQELDEAQRLIEEGFQREELALQQQQLDLEAQVADAADDQQQVALQQAKVDLEGSKHDLAQRKKAAAAKPAAIPPIAGAPTLAKPNLKPAAQRVPVPGATPGSALANGGGGSQGGGGLTLTIK
jgi:hypothetical protein